MDLQFYLFKIKDRTALNNTKNMANRQPENLSQHTDSSHLWKLIEKHYDPKTLGKMETLYALSNGYIGMRGCFEEGDPVSQSGTFINGFYESWPIVYPEEAYGFAKIGQTMIHVPDSSIIKLYVDDEAFYLPTANLCSYERSLDLQTGVLNREIIWETPAGKKISIKSQRLVSFKHRHLAAIAYEVTVIDNDAPIEIVSKIHYESYGADNSQPANYGDPRQTKEFSKRVLLPRMGSAKAGRVLLAHETHSSGLTLATGMDHTFACDSSFSIDSEYQADSGEVIFSINAQAGIPVRLTKYMTYHTSQRSSPQEMCTRAVRTLDRAVVQSFEALKSSQRAYLDDFWSRSDIHIEAELPTESPTKLAQQSATKSDGVIRKNTVQLAIRFNLFHILQATSRTDGLGLPAKGLTGQGYEGHYFWDTEIYVLPFLTYTNPQLAQNLLQFRYGLLDKARERAKAVSQKGALFPWRTINGEEASAYYEAGTAQYHINADIMFGLKKYVEVTGDRTFLYEKGAEMLIETARLWHDLGFFSAQENGQFCIHGVTGPDEYNTVVNDNLYTNFMAQENLYYAASTLGELKAKQPGRFQELADKTGLKASEMQDWQQAADKMYIPFNEKLDIHLQHDGFSDEQHWDFENTPADQYPLLLHFHPLFIYRHQVIKQADLVLAMFLLGDKFSLAQKQKNFDYYDPLTTGDSSLSACIQSIVASEVGHVELATAYALDAMLVDLENLSGNAQDGCHIASMGGSWMTLVYGFSGLRDYDGKISFNPKIPDWIKRLQFFLTVQGQLLSVELQPDSATYWLKEGRHLAIAHQGQDISLALNLPISAPIRPGY